MSPPPFRFHHVHGHNNELSKKNTTAKCIESDIILQTFLFTSRRIHCQEPILLSITNPEGSSPCIHFGFTTIDPNTLDNLECLDICSRICRSQNYELFEHMPRTTVQVRFCYDSFGIVRAIIDGKKHLSNTEEILDPSQPLWGLIYTNNAIGSVISLMNSLQVVGYVNPSDLYTGRFNRMCGSSIELSEERDKATCTGTDYNQRFLFSAVAIQPNERIKLKFTNLDREEPFAFGFTPVDPSRVVNVQNYHRMETNPRTWVRNICIKEDCDTISWSVDANNVVTYTVNGENTKLRGCDLDLSHDFWALIYLRGVGSCVEICKNEIPLLEPPTLDPDTLHYQPKEYGFNPMRMIVRYNPPDVVCLLGWEPVENDQRIVMQIQSKRNESQYSVIVGLTTVRSRSIIGTEIPSDEEMLEGDEDWLVVAKLSSESLHVGDEFTFFFTDDDRIRFRLNNAEDQYVPRPNYRLWPFFKVSSNNLRFKIFIGKVDATILAEGCLIGKPDTNGIASLITDLAQWKPPSKPSNLSKNQEECTICYKNGIDAVIYSCGHMCMCYECAKKQWVGRGNSGSCPLCRVPIKDVIKVFR